MSVIAIDKSASPDGDGTQHKVVVRRQDGSIVKGYFCAEDSIPALATSEQFLPRFLAEESGFRTTDGGTIGGLNWSEVKAIFFVSSFEGDSEQQPVQFYSQGPEIKSIWIEITFHDGEVMEGYAKNSLLNFSSGGFFLRPTSPGDNNQLIYVNRDAVVKLRVLGVSAEEYE
jgi:hypothetical protein